MILGALGVTSGNTSVLRNRTRTSCHCKFWQSPREIVKKLRFEMKVAHDGYIIHIIIKYNLFTFVFFSFPTGVWFGVCGWAGNFAQQFACT